MQPTREFNGAITGHNVFAGLHFETGAVMNNHFSDPDIDRPKILNAFKGRVNYALQKDRNQLCVPGTGHWFFHHPLYEAFRHGKGSQLLFVTAEAGGGKSTVMRTLADTISGSDDSALITYFFFKDDDDRLRSYDEALSGLIYQLLVQEPGLIKYVKKLYQKHGDGLKHDTNVMWKALGEIAINVQQDIFCVLDAIDECGAADTRQLVADMKNFFQDAEHANSRLKFIVSSRPYQDENHRYDDLFFPSTKNILHLVGEDAKVQHDIKEVIRSKAEELARKRHLSEAMQEMLVDKISAQNRHTRSFLAVHMAFELLDSHRRMHKGAGERTISIILADIPHSLGEQFDEMLNRSLDRDHARKLFCVILAARRTIKIEELKVVFSLTEANNLGFGPVQTYEDLELPTNDEDFKQLVRSKCGLFITFVGNSVHLFHQTAREYLLARIQPAPQDLLQHPSLFSIPTKSDQSSWKGCITSTDANLVCSLVCLDILNFTVPQKVPLEIFDDLEAGNHLDHALKSFISARPFFFYAALNWYEHVTSAGDMTKILGSNRYNAILDISKPQFWVWFLTIADYICSNTVKKKVPISSIWTPAELGQTKREYGLLLRENCIKKLYCLDNKVRALLDTEPAFRQDVSSENDRVTWTAQDGFHLIDRFHLAYGEYGWTSFSRAVDAAEQGDTERASILLPDIPLHTLIWTSITTGAPNALKEALASSENLSWLSNVPEHIIHRREKWDGWSSRDGKDLRESRQHSWTKPYPPSFVTILRASTMASSDSLFQALADWIDEHALRMKFAQQLWESGGFVVPSLSRRLILSGASIDDELWQDRKTALQVASTFWVHDALRTLLELGANPMKGANNSNALHWFSQYEKLYMGDGLVDIEPVAFRHIYQKSRITLSIEAIVDSVPNKYDLLNQQCGKGWTPLIHAVRSYRSSPTVVKALLEQGAEVDQRDRQGRTAVMHFFRGNGFVGRSTSILSHLLLAGADSKALNATGRTALSYWASKTTSTELSHLYPGFNAYNKAFHAVANIGPLSDEGALSQELYGLKIPIVVASRLGNSQMCLALLATGANPNEHGMDAGSPLTHNSGSVASDLEDLDWNPLLVALWSKAYVTAALLIEGGANIMFQTRKRKRTKYNKYRVIKGGSTPIHLAVAGGSESWYSADIGLETGGRSEGCSFRAAARPNHRISKPMRKKFEKFNRKTQDRRDKGDESSDPEYEKRSRVIVNDSRGSNLVPYDVPIKVKNASETLYKPFLHTITDKSSTSLQRQEVLVELMLSRGASSNACTVQNITPLIICVKQRLLNLVEILLKYGADPNISGSGGCTPLMIAAQAGCHDIVERLLTSGANPDAQLSVKGPNECKCSAFIEFKHWTFTSCDAPFTALAFAAESGHERVVELLLKHGANPNLKIIHHAHGKLLSRRDKRHQQGSPSTSDDESELEPDQWKGFISVATALTWAREGVRDLLLHHGADPDKEEAIQECDCIIGRRAEHGQFGDSDDDYPSRSSSRIPTGRRRRDSSQDSSVVSSDSEDMIT